MKFTLVVCTFQRPGPLLNLLNSVEAQSLYPDQILIIDGSLDDETERELKDQNFRNLEYFRTDEQYRGLTKQRNFGIKKVQKSSEIICFLDDDTVLTSTYFENLIGTYGVFPDCIGVGGYIMDETKWEITGRENIPYHEFEYDGWKRILGNRNVLRKKLGLLSESSPGYMPEEGNGFSTGFLPPSGKTYTVEFFMGGVASYRKNLFKKIGFSEYFEGYGLYEDMEFCLRASRIGHLYVNTGARLYHNHEDGGRPNKFNYGQMVIRNGWYVWRTKYQSPSLKARIKWHATAILLTLVRIGNIINTSRKREAFSESLGRLSGWGSLLIKKPKSIN